MTMIEKVARALLLARMRSVNPDPAWAERQWLACDQEEYLYAARAAVEAMREPTRAQLDAGASAAEDALDETTGSDADGNMHTSIWLRSDAAIEIYRAMITAALSEKT